MLNEAIKRYIDANYAPFLEEPPQALLSAISNLGEGFSDKLICLIDERFEKDSDFYESANISRQVFSYMKSNRNYKPSRPIIFACIIALRLNAAEAESLLKTAGLAFSNSNLSDVIIRYFIENGLYDMEEINEILYDYGQPLLGSN